MVFVAFGPPPNLESVRAQSSLQSHTLTIFSAMAGEVDHGMELRMILAESWTLLFSMV